MDTAVYLNIFFLCVVMMTVRKITPSFSLSLFLSLMLINSFERWKGHKMSSFHLGTIHSPHGQHNLNLRFWSFPQVVAILQKFYSHSESALGLLFIKELILRFRHCSKWVGRQAFAFICQVSKAQQEPALRGHVFCSAMEFHP
jgi:hypothetical protein